MREGQYRLRARGGLSGSSPCRVALLARHVPLVLATALVALTPGLVEAAFSHAMVDVEMVEFAFRPRTIYLQAGMPVRIILRNHGQIAHQFESKALHSLPVRIIDERIHTEARGLDIVRLAPAASARLEFLPRRKGRVEFACTIEGHREAGMRGTLEIR